MGLIYTKSNKKNCENKNNISATSKPIKNKKKLKCFPFSAKRKENEKIRISIRNSKRKLGQTKTTLKESEPQPPPPIVLAPKPGTSEHSATIQGYERQMIERIQEQLRKDSQPFILNQLMISTQFFGFYQRYVDSRRTVL